MLFKLTCLCVCSSNLKDSVESVLGGQLKRHQIFSSIHFGLAPWDIILLVGDVHQIFKAQRFFVLLFNLKCRIIFMCNLSSTPLAKHHVYEC